MLFLSAIRVALVQWFYSDEVDRFKTADRAIIPKFTLRNLIVAL